MLKLISIVISIAFFHLSLAQFGVQQGSEFCDPNAQGQITQCAQELRQLGVFTNNGQGGVDALTWEQIRRRSRQYFTQICDAYRRFGTCVDRGNYRTSCWSVEPIKAQYAVADAALDYVCGQGYYGMLNNWDCFLQAATRSDVIQCEARILADARGGSYADLRQGDRACGVLQDYMGCISRPINEQCGNDAWRHVKEAVQRPTRVYLPYCTLAGSTYLPSMILMASGLIILKFVWA